MTNWIDAVGILASMISLLIFLPQATLMWRNRHNVEALAGVSVMMQCAVLANAVTWGVYGVLTQAFWVAAPGLLNGPLALVTLWLTMRARRSAAKASALVDAACALCAGGVPHQIFVTAPPGWGSVMPCSPASRPHGVIVTDDESVRRLRMSLAPQGGTP